MTSTPETGVESKDHKDNFGVRLEQIFGSPLTTDLNRHFDFILNKLEQLLLDLVFEYKKRVPDWETRLGEYKAGRLKLTEESGHLEPKVGILLEELACKFFNIPDVVNMLSSVLGQIAKLKQVDDFVGDFISSNTIQDTQAIVSPGGSTRNITSPGDQEMKIRNLHDRLKVVCFILISGGVELTPETVKITRGLPPEGSMRKEPYYLIEIPMLERIVLECLEEGNKVFIFDSRKLTSQKVFEILEGRAITMELLKSLSKDELQILCEMNDGTGTSIVHNTRGNGWEARISENLFGDIQINSISRLGRYQEQASKIRSRGVVEVDPGMIEGSGEKWGTLKEFINVARSGGMTVSSEERLNLMGVRVIIPDRIHARWSPILFNFSDLFGEVKKDSHVVFNATQLEKGQDGWEDFYVARDEKGLELHFGSNGSISRKIKSDFGIEYPSSNVSVVVKDNIDSLRYVETRSNSGTGPKIKLTAYEDLLSRPNIEGMNFREYLCLPVVEKEGIENAYLDVDGVRYGTLGYVIHAAGKPKFGDPISISGLNAKLTDLLKEGDIVEARSSSGNKIGGGLKRVGPLLEYLKWWNSLDAIFADKFTKFNGQRYATNQFYKAQIEKNFGKVVGMNNIVNAVNSLKGETENPVRSMDCKLEYEVTNEKGETKKRYKLVSGGQFSYEQIVGELLDAGVLEKAIE